MSKPLIVQSDRTMLLEVDNPEFEACQSVVSKFAELEKSPEYLHTYRISPLSLWNAASIKMSADEIVECLEKFSRYSVPKNIVNEIREQISRYGKVKLVKEESGELAILSNEKGFLQEIGNHRAVQPFIESTFPDKIYIKKEYRGHIKQALIKIGFPVEDLAGYDEGNKYGFNLRPTSISGKKFGMRDYQRACVEVFHAGGGNEGGSGVVVLPCGAGKTIVGIGVMQIVGAETLILVTNTLSIRQWRNEILDKTDIPPEDIGEYSGEVKEIRPITIATYNILTHRKKKGGDFTHFHLFGANNWGLIVYDEVHLLPAPVFRMTSELQAKRRLGLTATLVREDGLEEDVFSLIGPKKYDVPWKELESKSWIAEAKCKEIRVSMEDDLRLKYSIADDREKFRLASENPEKMKAIDLIMKKHSESHLLVIGQYINQLEEISKKFNIPLITGKTPLPERQTLYDAFRSGKIKSLVVSKVANFSIDLPDANIAIQVSGTFGSRQEEAQRLGRILRPKGHDNTAVFYSLISRDTNEERFGQNRQLFLTEQGYEYEIYTLDQFREAQEELAQLQLNNV
ncbi:MULTISPECIES: DNA repair helicase XPB [Leptospira]|uniref:DNA 3'-5' helicase n=4 Tax=Leptospira kirschneri TaxID=29507 RepID=A0A1T1DP61_9LEPT|nr:MULTISPECIES: DNA repair helicase XPB [Leptospira]EMO77860.1 type III restriction enzyme, res subunit [Leptospira kirschneri str. 200801925]EJO70799.1 type III restriction enzyme, res subunit [Leptospira kirschneri serovar Grippotyphosa str. RM52]EKO15066.1 type III restriction enzyme, res subunit [Leptospira kirschneri str. H1]EKO51034.1 type III restriction enzyme, res subunit [Leptospira kirschneri str. 200802841]EKP03463.1 type III restriction enzyme, res subunit [Leptospira kirschneri 